MKRIITLFNKPENYIKIMESPLGYIIDFFLGLYRKYTVNEVDERITNNIEGIKEMNIPLSWFSEYKPLGISGIARLKNSDDFLEKIIESYIPYLDEIILVNNLSTDKTEEICKKLVKKHPEKIKYFEYPYVIGWCDIDNKYPTNSIHSMAYYTNWCFSQGKYKYIMRLDDDNLPIMSTWTKIRKFILKKQPNKYCIYWGLNVLRNSKTNKINIFNQIPYSGLGGDHGIFPVSKKTYCKQEGYFEILKFGIGYKRFGFSFFHLKFLRKGSGYLNTDSRNKEILAPINKLYNLDNYSNISNYIKDKDYNNLITNFINEAK